MKLSATAAACLTFCLATSCNGNVDRVVEPLRPDRTNPDRFVCDAAGDRPRIPVEYQVDWTRALAAPTVAAAVALAREEHARYVASIRNREGVIVAYITNIEGRLFICFNNMQWQREFYARLDQVPSR